MVSALHSFIEAGNVVFGTRECVKHAKKMKSVFVTSDIRPSSLALLEKHGVLIESLDVTKQEAMDKLSLAFQCEAFGVRN